MKPAKKNLALALVALPLLSVPSLLAQPFGQWDFNNSNLVATVGTDLQYADGGGGATATATAFGSTADLGIAQINGTNAIVMRFPAATNGQGYSMPTPAANGGGATVNQYTLLMDVFYPAASATKIRPLIRTYSLGATAEYIIIDANGGVGPAVLGPGGVNAAAVGALQGNTWYRLGVVVNAGGAIRVYTNGVEMGSFTGGALDGFFALDPGATALILGSTSTNAALGYVNSIQLRNVALSAGQMSALGGPSADGIPQTIPPVPSFIASRSPGVGEVNVSEEPTINVVLDQGDTTVNSGSIVLKLDGTAVGTMTPTPPTYTNSYTVPPRLDPLSTHTLTLTWSDSVVGNKTNSWQFTVKNYQVVTLPAPFYFQNFDSLTENATNGVALPAGWSVANQTAPGNAGYSLDDRNSDTYKDWVLITASRFSGWSAERTDLPTIILNGVKLTSLASGNLMWAESDQRCGGCNGQFSDLFTGPISCTGRTNVYVAFKSIYEQNQDNMDFMEYSVDGGVNWLPVLYYFDSDPSQPADIIYTNGIPDVPATFARVDANRNWSPDTVSVHATNYGSYIKAPISSIKTTDIFPRFNDSTTDGKRIEVVRLTQADGKADVRFRANANGTSAWFWGIDDFGLYEINAPVITSQPSSQTRDAGTPVTFTVVASATPAPTYQWQFNSVNIPGATGSSYTFTAETNNAGNYRAVVSNPFGTLNSAQATLTVISTPIFTTHLRGQVADPNDNITFTSAVRGRSPISLVWKHNGVTVPGASSTNLSLNWVQAGDAGDYAIIASNSDGSATSAVKLVVYSGPINNQLVVHLKFDNDYTDSSGHGNNATAVGSPSFTGAAKIGTGAFRFTSAQESNNFNYATLGYPNDLKFGDTNDFSVSMWVQLPVGGWKGDPSFLANKETWRSGGSRGWVLATDSDAHFQWNYREITPNNRRDYDGPAGTFSAAAWRHLVVVFQRNGTIYTYVDGNLVNAQSSQTFSGLLNSVKLPPSNIDTDDIAGRAVNVGQDGEGLYVDAFNVGTTNCVADDVGIWRRALTGQEALAIYTAGQQGLHLEQAAVFGRLCIIKNGANINVTWAGGTGIRLQKTPSLSPAAWADVPGTTGASSYSEPAGSGAFFRLHRP